MKLIGSREETLASIKLTDDEIKADCVLIVVITLRSIINGSSTWRRWWLILVTLNGELRKAAATIRPE
jgi:hypothetical protein